MNNKITCDQDESDYLDVAYRSDGGCIILICENSHSKRILLREEKVEDLIGILEKSLSKKQPEQVTSEGITVKEYAKVVDAILTTPLESNISKLALLHKINNGYLEEEV